MATIRRGIMAASLLILVTLPGAPAFAPASARQAESREEPGPPLALATVASAALTASGGEAVVWLVQTDPAAGTDLPLRVVLAERRLPRMHGEHGAFRRRAAPVRETRVRPGEATTLAGAAIDALAVGIALRPASTTPPDLPAGVLISEPFPAPDTPGSHLHLEVRRGVLAPGDRASLPGHGTPVLLLAIDRPLQVTPHGEAPIALGRGEITLLAQANALRVHNPGRQPATVVLALIAPGEASPGPRPADAGPRDAAGDPAIDEAWRRSGCHLNPGNPACQAVALAATCQLDPRAAGCDADSDGDTCRDTAEVRAALDPFDAGDCLGGHDGSPLLNCLFPGAVTACDGSHPTLPGACDALPDPRHAAHPGKPDGCLPPLPDDVDCGVRERDPACDGFSPALAAG